MDRKIKKNMCPHIGKIKFRSSRKKECVVCGDKKHPRLCTSCGRVFCCESLNAHDTQHFKKTKHPIIKPVHCPYDFLWCYACKAYLE